jgi:hypothetical protein
MPLMRGLLSLIEQQAERIKALALRYTAAEERLAVYNSGGFADADALAAKMIEVMDRATKAERELAELQSATNILMVQPWAERDAAEARAAALQASLLDAHATWHGCRLLKPERGLPAGRPCDDCIAATDAAIRAAGEGT